MLVPLVFALVAGLNAPHQTPTLYERVVERPDPNNGYEDYLRAADAIDDPVIRYFLEWSPQQLEMVLERRRAALEGTKNVSDEKGLLPAPTWTRSDEDLLPLLRDMHGLTYLEVQQRMTERFAKALDIVRAGNLKQVWDPRTSLSLTTAFPELGQFKTLGKLFAADAFVRFARGDSRGGANDLLDGLTFARRIQTSTMISHLVGLATQGIVLAEAERNLTSIDQRSAEKIARTMDDAVAEPSPFRSIVQREREWTIKSLDETLDSPTQQQINELDESHPGAGQMLSRMNSSQRTEAKARIASKVKLYFDDVAKMLENDESTWPIKAGRVSSPETVTTIDDFVDAVADTMTPVIAQATSATMLRRTQLRLLGLHARVIDFRWKHGHLPMTLSEAVPEKLLFDPLAKGPFIYERTDTGYRLYSNGSSETGVVELKWKRSLPVGNNDPVPPR